MNFRGPRIRDPAYRLPRTPQPVEKVVVGSVGSPKHPRTQAKTLQNRGFKPLNRGQKRARGSFSTGWCLLGGWVNRGQITPPSDPPTPPRSAARAKRPTSAG